MVTETGTDKKINSGKVLRVMTLPGFIPRAKTLFGSGFGYLAFLIANIYNLIRLLPNDHPYLNPDNIGRFGIRHVIAQAANRLVMDWRNADQIIVFVTILFGIVLLFAQFFFLLYALMIQPVMAIPLGIFDTPNPQNDIAFLLLDRVFGVQDMFCNIAGECSAVQPQLRMPFHIALHELFSFYSSGLLIVAVFIFLYFLVVVVVETTATGTPFGQRFQNIWAPIRLVVAIGLLVPINFGLNSAQYITLYAAKLGSGLATNGWLTFNQAIRDNPSGGGFGFITHGDNPIGEGATLVALPPRPDPAVLIQFMSLVHTCAYAYWKTDEDRAIAPGLPQPPSPGFFIRPYFVKNVFPWNLNTDPVMEVTPATTHIQGLDFYSNGDIIIRFGEFDPANYPNEKGNVKPLCGEIRIKVSDLEMRGTGQGPDRVIREYLEIVKSMWFDDDLFVHFAQRVVEQTLPVEPQIPCAVGCGVPQYLADCEPVVVGAPPPACMRPPGANWKQLVTNDYAGILWSEFGPLMVTTGIPFIDALLGFLAYAPGNAWSDYAIWGGMDADIELDVLQRGWGGAGIWYNRIAQINGAFMTSVIDMPTLESYPLVMEQIREQRRRHDAEVDPATQFDPTQGGRGVVTIEGGAEALAIAASLNWVHQYWNTDGTNQQDPEKDITGNVFIDAINMLLGLYKLQDLRDKPINIHPLAELSALGKGLVESAIRNMAISTSTAFLGGMMGVLSETTGALLSATSSFFMTMAFVGLTAGFILYYVLPFMPFMYFFFAVGTWIKAIFEAMVGVPLWALAHLRLDGEGLPGDSAQNGYFLLLEIFIRPILIVFGLVAAIAIFAAQARLLNIMFDIVILNLTGFEDGTTANVDIPGLGSLERSAIDQFFFTIIYAIILYMLATTSFKLIDKIPNEIMRWSGAGVSSFGDNAESAVQGLSRYASIGGFQIGSQLTQGVQSGATGLGRTAGGALGAMATRSQGG